MYRLSSPLSRLTAATYHDVNASNTASNRYNETLAYDLRGNITSLQRTGYFSSTCNYGQIDNLTYTYTASTNRLASIADSAPASQKTHGFNPGAGGAGYTYDANGNLKTDSYKGITNIAYNQLNLPNSITFSSGNTIEWVYDAAGMKLRKIVKQGATVQYEQTYAGGLEYRKNGTGSTRVEALYHAEGRYLNLNAEVSNTLLWQKEYALRDHLGNTRMMFADKNANGIVETPGEITQENHYYPFGLGYEGPWLMNDAVARDNKYQYNGKEWNDDWGLKWNDFGLRWYDPAIGRWNGVDPVIKYWESPYAPMSNNPILFIDPNGADFVNVHKERKQKAQEDLNAAQTRLNASNMTMEKYADTKTNDLKGDQKKAYKAAINEQKEAQSAVELASSNLKKEELFEQVVDMVLSEFKTTNPKEFDRWNDFVVPGANHETNILLSAQDFPISILDKNGFPTGQTTTEGITWSGNSKAPISIRLRIGWVGSPTDAKAVSGNTADTFHALGHIDGALIGKNTEDHANAYERTHYSSIKKQ